MAVCVLSWLANHGVYRRLPSKTIEMSSYVLSCLEQHVTFNHGVEGSSPSALTNKIRYLVRI
jgi:hypothetical protein